MFARHGAGASGRSALRDLSRQCQDEKQMSYANAKAVPFVAIVGENEMNEGKVTLKNMATGEQLLLTPDEMINIIKNNPSGYNLTAFVVTL